MTAGRDQLGQLLGRAAREAGVLRVLIVGASRRAPVVRARFAFCWAAYGLPGASTRAIGQLLGGRDHSTVLSAIRRADGLRDSDPRFRDLTDRLSRAVEIARG